MFDQIARSLRVTAGITVVFVCSCGSPQMVNMEQSLSAHASRIIEWIEQGQVALVAADLHYPAHLSRPERELDKTNVEDAIRFLLGEFGAVEQTRLLADPVENVEVGIFGGGLPYWSSLGELVTRDFLYEAQFRGLGMGIIKVSFFETKQGWETRAVAFGLPLSRSDAQHRLSDIAQRLSTALMDEPKP
jgi:hypothetical protein